MIKITKAYLKLRQLEKRAKQDNGSSFKRRHNFSIREPYNAAAALVMYKNPQSEKEINLVGQIGRAYPEHARKSFEILKRQTGEVAISNLGKLNKYSSIKISIAENLIKRLEGEADVGSAINALKEREDNDAFLLARILNVCDGLKSDFKFSEVGRTALEDIVWELSEKISDEFFIKAVLSRHDTKEQDKAFRNLLVRAENSEFLSSCFENASAPLSEVFDRIYKAETRVRRERSSREIKAINAADPLVQALRAA